jgi:hypothetical protein
MGSSFEIVIVLMVFCRRGRNYLSGAERLASLLRAL